jgi:hypothetical protein
MECTGKQVQGQVGPVEEAELDGEAIEAKGSEPSRSTSTQPSAEVDDGPPGVVDDSDSDDDRPSRWDGARSESAANS